MAPQPLPKKHLSLIHLKAFFHEQQIPPPCISRGPLLGRHHQLCKRSKCFHLLSFSESDTRCQEYFDNNLDNHPPSPMSPNHRAIAKRTPLWQNAYVAKLSVGQAIIVPMSYNNIYVTSDASAGEMFSLSDITRLVLFRDSSNQFHGRVVTYVPDSAARPATSQYTGVVFYEDW